MEFSFLNDFVKQFSDSLPPALQAFKGELEDQFKHSLARVLQSLNLVTRQEFDIQVEVLSKARTKLEELEQKISSLEDLNSSKAMCQEKTK